MSTAAASSAETCAKMVVASMCTVGIITAMRVCVNIPLLKTVSTAPNINAANLTATTVDGPDPNTAHTINNSTRQRRALLCRVILSTDALDSSYHKYLFTKFLLFFCGKV